MADLVFNAAKGLIAALHDRVKNNDPDNSVLILVLLKAAESDAGIRDRATLGQILANGSTEADFTNYARKVMTDAAINLAAVDNANDRVDCDFPDQTWTQAGGAVNNNLVAAVLCYDPDSTGGTDADLIPLCKWDFVISTNGSDLVAQVAAAGYFGAQ